MHLSSHWQLLSDKYIRTVLYTARSTRQRFKRACLASVDAGPDQAVSMDHTMHVVSMWGLQAGTVELSLIDVGLACLPISCVHWQQKFLGGAQWCCSYQPPAPGLRAHLLQL